MSLIKLIKYALPAFFLLQAWLSFLFGRGKGLVVMSYLKDGELTMVTNLYSSGSDDNLAIQIGLILYSIAGVWFFFRRKKCISIIDTSFFVFICLLQLTFLILIEAGSVLDTIYYGKDYILIGWVANFVVIITVFIKLLLAEKNLQK